MSSSSSSTSLQSRCQPPSPYYRLRRSTSDLHRRRCSMLAKAPTRTPRSPSEPRILLAFLSASRATNSWRTPRKIFSACRSSSTCTDQDLQAELVEEAEASVAAAGSGELDIEVVVHLLRVARPHYRGGCARGSQDQERHLWTKSWMAKTSAPTFKELVKR